MTCNTGEWNAGDFNTGNCNKGNSNTGDSNTGDLNTGNCNTGNFNTGDSNTGDYNTGDSSTGDCNTGDYNTGDCNTGDYNTGDCNTGDCNTGRYHVGCFNTVTAEKAYYFNKLIDKSDWDKVEKPAWMRQAKPSTWVSSDDMTSEEKEENPSYNVAGGYLRVNDMMAEWLTAYESASPEDIQAVRDLPAFDYDVFEEITGLNLREGQSTESCEGREIEIDGVTYVLQLKEQSHVK